MTAPGWHFRVRSGGGRWGAGLGGGLFLLLGLCMLGGAGYLANDTRQALATGQVVEGQVIDLIEARDSDGDTTYRPRVEFTTSDGETIQFTSTSGSNPAAFDVGESVPVVYDPASPRRARINTFFQLWLAPIIMTGVGVAFTAVGGIGAFGAPRLPASDPVPTEAATVPAMAAASRAVERRARD